MKMKFDIRSLVCGALVGAALILLTGAALPEQREKGWEYTTHTYGGSFQPPMENLNKLGEQGWELAGVLTSDTGSRGLIFKRPAPRRVGE